MYLLCTAIPALNLGRPSFCCERRALRLRLQVLRSSHCLLMRGLPKILTLDPHSDMQVYQALNALGSVPWQINRDILDIVEELYEDETGYKHLKIPAKQALDIPLPEPPAHTFRTDRTKNGGLIARVRPCVV